MKCGTERTNGACSSVWERRHVAFDSERVDERGEFTQPDPIGLAGGLNLYGYANGDPINFSDPFGLCPEKETGRKCRLHDVFSVAFSIGFGVGASANLSRAVTGEIDFQFGPTYTADYSASGITRETDTSPSFAVGASAGFGAVGFRFAGDARDGDQSGIHLLGETVGAELPQSTATGRVKVQAILGAEVKLNFAAAKEILSNLFRDK